MLYNNLRSGMLAPVKYATLIAHYRTQVAIGKALAVTQQAVSRWAKTGIVPPKKAELVQKKTRGKLKVDPSVYA